MSHNVNIVEYLEIFVAISWILCVFFLSPKVLVIVKISKDTQLRKQIGSKDTEGGRMADKNKKFVWYTHTHMYINISVLLLILSIGGATPIAAAATTWYKN